MSNIDNAAEQLIAVIRESEVYREYTAQLEKVKQVPELKEQIDEFRKCNYQFQTSGEVAFDKIEEFEKQYESFRENPLVADFLAAELAFCRMMQNLNMRVMEAIHFE